MPDKWLTKKTLLQRAQDPDDSQAWEDFVSYYEGFISIVLSRMGLSTTEQEDLSQEILLKLWKNLKSFELDAERAKFRTWLSTLIRNRTLDYFRKSKRQPKMKTLEDIDIISEPELDKIVKKEWERYLTGRAMENVKKLFSGAAIRAFELTLLGKEADEISQDLDIGKESVKTLKNRVKVRLIKEIELLRRELEF